MPSEIEDEFQIHVPSDMLQKECNNFFLQLLVWIMSCHTPGTYMHVSSISTTVHIYYKRALLGIFTMVIPPVMFIL